MRTHHEFDIHLRSQLLADLKDKTAELERQLTDARLSLDRELAETASTGNPGSNWAPSPEGRTQILLNHGRRTAYKAGLTRGRKVAATAAILAIGMTILVLALSGGGAAWPASVAKVQRIGILPVRFAVQGQYMPVHPDAFGQKWNVQVTIAPVIPKLIRGNVLEDW